MNLMIPGTMIINERDKMDNDLPITGIAGRKDFTVIGLQKFYMNSEVGFVRKLLSTLEMFDITFEHDSFRNRYGVNCNRQ